MSPAKLKAIEDELAFGIMTHVLMIVIMIASAFSPMTVENKLTVAGVIILVCLATTIVLYFEMREEMQERKRDYYGPGNATLVVMGDFDVNFSQEFLGDSGRDAIANQDSHQRTKDSARSLKFSRYAGKTPLTCAHSRPMKMR